MQAYHKYYGRFIHKFRFGKEGASINSSEVTTLAGKCNRWSSVMVCTYTLNASFLSLQEATAPKNVLLLMAKIIYDWNSMNISNNDNWLPNEAYQHAYLITQTASYGIWICIYVTGEFSDHLCQNPCQMGMSTISQMRCQAGIQWYYRKTLTSDRNLVKARWMYENKIVRKLLLCRIIDVCFYTGMG